jgi:hypothetical protein
MKQKRVHIGVAVERDRVTAFARRGALVQQLAIDVDAAAGNDIAAAFVALRDQLKGVFGHELDDARVAIALMPPHADTRLLPLPPLRQAEADAVVRRDAGRWFFGVAVPRVTAVQVAPGLPVLAGAAEAPLLDTLHAAADAVGWRVDTLTTAGAAWIVAASSAAQDVRSAGARNVARAARDRHVPDSAPSTVVAVHAGTAHIMQVVGGRAAALRRLPAAETDEIIAAAGEVSAATGRRVVLMMDDDVRPVFARRFTEAGWSVATGGSAAVAAAQYAGSAALRLETASMAAGRSARERRQAVRLAVAAAVLVLATAAVELWGATRELDAVRGRRAEIRAQVSPLLALRDSIARLDTQAADIEAAGNSSPRWTAALFDLALLLPPESWLTRLHATGDTLVMDAQGERAGAALQALRGSASLRDTRLVGVVDRELADGATSSERFRIRARVEAP